MSGLPSVLAGLFIYRSFILPYAKKFTLFSFNGFMASLARHDHGPNHHARSRSCSGRSRRAAEASLAMGSSLPATWSVVLPPPDRHHDGRHPRYRACRGRDRTLLTPRSATT
jgi:hypothetical protein